MQTYTLRCSRLIVGIFAVLALAAILVPAAHAQDELVTTLKKKYRLTDINMQGVAANPGTVLTVEADGINAEPYPTMITFENPVVDGRVKQRSKTWGLIKSSNLQILQPGQKVYITKINSSSQSQDDSLKITILTCDAVLATYVTGANRYSSGTAYQTPKRYSTTLAFKLPKGSLNQMSADEASKLIEAVLSVNPANQVRARDSGTVARSCEPHCAVSSTTGTTLGSAIVAPADTPPNTQGGTQTIALGQTINQVTAIMGRPMQIVDLGPKQIYKYQNMKVIFLNGKVSDVQ